MYYFIFFIVFFINQMQGFYFVDFDNSMKREEYQTFLENEKVERLYSIFKKLYEKKSDHFIPLEKQSIPKLFHYIWLGTRLPEEFIPYLQSWIEKHPDWIFIFWVDNPENYFLGTVLEGADFKEIEKVLDGFGSNFVVDVKNLTFDNRSFFDQATNYAEKSDILRYEVVYRFGGVYIDVDMESLYSLDILHEYFDFYTGLQPIDTEMIQLGLALFGACPGHPVIKHAIDTIKKDRDKGKIVVKTGPIHFTKSFLSTIGVSDYNDIVLPASYFYPCDYNQAGFPAREWKKPESFTVHHWAGSWL